MKGNVTHTGPDIVSETFRTNVNDATHGVDMERGEVPDAIVKQPRSEGPKIL
jgi:hypothetical protein